ncbi:MAG: flagellar biosynthesis anti-sigma factor FlgM [Kofleriaceae bacterium]
MRIDPKLHTPILERTTTEPVAPPRTELKEHDAAVVTLSSAGAAVQAGAPAEVLSARVEQLRLLIERGEYTVDLDQLAARIADDDIARSEGSR